MSASDIMITAFTCSLIHLIMVEYLGAKHIRRSARLYFSYLSLMSLIYFSVHTVIREPFLYYPVTLFLFPACTCYFYRFGTAEAFALSMLSDIIILFGELLAQFFNLQGPKAGFLYTAVKNLFSLVFAALVTAIAELIKKRPANKKPAGSNICSILFFALINAALNFYFLLINENFHKTNLANLSFRMLVFIFLTYVLSLKSKERFEQKTRDCARLSRYIRQIENECDDLAGLKHNFSNILLSINGYLYDNRFSELRDYLNNHVLKDYCRNLNYSFLTSLKFIQNPALKGIIFSKLNQAAAKNIKLFINIFSKIEISNIDPADLVKIIGILLDNAIEACENSQDNELHLGMDSDNTHTSILIGNTYCSLPDPELIYERGFSTKGNNRGLGLYYLRKILSLYPHAHLKTTVSDNIFFQELIIMK